LKAGDILRFDVTAIRRGHFSDLSRSASIGSPPGEAKRLYVALRGAVEAMVSSVRPGFPVKELFRMGMEKVRGAGYPSYQRGNLGHGLGLGHYEEPFITPENDTPLQPGMVLAVEAPYYVAGRFGLNVENNVLVTENGHEILDDLSLDLMRCA
jgi:Xaa-Pro aminopeptidase